MSNYKHKKPARRPRIEEAKPLATAKALQHLAVTGDERGAAEIMGCHRDTVRRMLARDDDSFATVKKVIAARAFELSAAAQEQALARVEQLTPMQAAVAAKLSAQSGLELTEDPTPLVNINLLGELGVALAAVEALRSKAAQANGTEANNGEGDAPKES